MEEAKDTSRGRRTLESRAALPGCRICLLPRDLSPSPEWGVKKAAELSWIARARSRIQNFHQSIDELFGAEPVESPEDGKLIVPCQCKGTMKYVHRGCLNVWRMNSTRRDSYYKCEQCFSTYKFGETGWSRFLASPIITRVMGAGVFLTWFYGWFLFVILTQRITGGNTDGMFYVDYQDLTAMGHHRSFIIPEPTGTPPVEQPTGGIYTQPTGSILDYFTDFGQPEPEPPHTSSYFNDRFTMLPDYLRNILTSYLLEIVYTMVIVALFDTLITNPSVILSVNMIYLLWRCVKSGGQFELAWLAACIGFALARCVMTINSVVSAIIQRYIKLRCIQIVNLEEELCTATVGNDGHQRHLRVEKQLF